MAEETGHVPALALELERLAVRRLDHLADPFLPEDRGHRRERRCLAVDHEGAPDRPAQAAHPATSPTATPTTTTAASPWGISWC